MPQLSRSVPDVIQWKPSLVLLLTDDFTGERRLRGEVTVRIGTTQPLVPKQPEATFVFLDLPKGNYSVSIRSHDDPSLYVPVDIPVTLPLSSDRWPAYPELGLANPNLPLDDPRQPAAYRAQRALVALKPTAEYPFPAGTTLARGTVSADGKPLGAAVVRRKDDDSVGYQTGDDGNFVLYFASVRGRSESVNLIASHVSRPDATATVDLMRGTTVAVDIAMVP